MYDNFHTQVNITKHLESTEPIIMERIEYNVGALYNAAELPLPGIIYCTSPRDAIDKIRYMNIAPYSDAFTKIRFDLRRRVREHTSSGRVGRANGLRGAPNMSMPSIWNQQRISDGLERIPRMLLIESWPKQESQGQISPWLMAGDVRWMQEAYLDRENELRVDEMATLRYLMRVLVLTHVLLLNDQVVLVIDRPIRMQRDQALTMHNETELAWEYKDGTGAAFWHGTMIPEEWVKGQLPHPREALTITNVEIRRCACEMLGWDNILEELSAVTINSNADPEIGILVEVMLPDMRGGAGGRSWGAQDAPAKFLVVRCGTGRQFALPVPPDMRTALEANAWTYGMSPSEYKPTIRT